MCYIMYQGLRETKVKLRLKHYLNLRKQNKIFKNLRLQRIKAKLQTKVFYILDTIHNLSKAVVSFQNF